MHRTHRLKITKPYIDLAIFLTGSLALSTALANDINSLTQLKKMSLEDLMNVEITIASKTPQKISDTAAAVYIVTQDDIRRMGATSIPEALRGVPGLQVARIDANKWAISIRGMSNIFANKLLVMIDGRTLYTPLFSGVDWDIQDTLLEDIDRIEIIRGPGAAVWGANAVNGVINIITQSSKDTQGGLLTGTVGTEQGIVAARYGNQLGDDAYYRVFAKYRNQDNGVFVDGSEASDGWHDLHTGFRVDWQNDANNRITLHGNLYQGNMGGELSMLTPESSPPDRFVDKTSDIWGGNIQARWSQDLAQQAKQSLQFYYDFESRDSAFVKSQRGSVDLNYQYSFVPWQQHTLTTGAGYRYQYDHLPAGDLTQVRTLFDPSRRQDQLFSAFIQDHITLAENTLWLTLGSKFEHNSYTGFEIQPNARLSWRPANEQLLWASVSRAVRTPSRWEHDAALLTVGAVKQGLVFGLEGNPDFDSETLIAYELGYRFQPHQRLHLDLALFYNDYDNLLYFKPSKLTAPPQISPLVAIIGQPENVLYGETYGFEVSLNWQPNQFWTLRGNYTLMDIQLHTPIKSPVPTLEQSTEGATPSHQASLLSSYQLRNNLTLNLFGRYVGELPHTDISDYITLDFGVEWKPAKSLTLSLYGRNLLYDERLEFIEGSTNLSSTQAERQAYLRIAWGF